MGTSQARVMDLFEITLLMNITLSGCWVGGGAHAFVMQWAAVKGVEVNIHEYVL